MASTDPKSSIIAHLLQAVVQVLKIQVSTAVELKSIGATDKIETLNVAVAAVMGITSSKYAGSLVLCFPAPIFMSLVGRMFGEDVTAIDDGNADAAGELLNIIYGMARPKINQMGYDFTPSIPTVIRGKEINVTQPEGMRLIRTNCATELGEFQLVVGLKENAGKEA